MADVLPSQHPKERMACRRGLPRPESQLSTEHGAAPKGEHGGRRRPMPSLNQSVGQPSLAELRRALVSAGARTEGTAELG